MSANPNKPVVQMKLRDEAHELLHTQRLLPLVEEWGEVFIGGSYYYDLMVWRDLDIYINAPEMTISAFFQLGAKITAHFAAVKSYFTDNRGNEPHGLYWGIRLGDTRAGAWKLDIWALDQVGYERHRNYAQQIQHLLTPESRALILQIKQAYWQTVEYRNQVTSHAIYDAVLHHHVKGLDEFKRYLQQHESLDNGGR